jgi:hypothetical protein
MLECDMGDAPDFLIVEPLGVFANDLPVATIFDIVPFLNITGFIMCHSPLNPMVIAETLAAMAEDKIMIVAGRRQAGVHPAGADGSGLSEVQGRTEDGASRATA